MKKLTVLGSTGSIGKQTLEVVRNNPEDFTVCGLSCRSDTELLFSQIKEFNPEAAAAADSEAAYALMKRIKSELPECRTEILAGEKASVQLAEYDSADIAVAAIVGIAGFLPVISAIKAGKDIALANKETLVAAGDIVMPLAKEKGVRILPVDSEHSAIWQCLWGQPKNSIDRILLTASGGPFRGKSRSELENVTVEEALNHPTWSMGGKITVDSATMMNKGLEVLEASHLFGLNTDKIDVVVHPQSVIHSMVAMKDGSVMAQMGRPSMIVPITVALYYPQRGEGFSEKFSPFEAYASDITFEKCDTEAFGLLEAAYHAGKAGGSVPAVMNSANEEAVGAFLNREISFLDIEYFVRRCMERHEKEGILQTITTEAVSELDKWARRAVRDDINRGRAV